MYRLLDPHAIVATADTLNHRITERFPDSGLSRVSLELLAVTRESVHRIERLRRPYWPARTAVVIGLVIILAATVGLLIALPLQTAAGAGLSEILQGLEAAVNDVVFIGVTIYFLLTIEGRFKRRHALHALRELRSIAHVIDMHQLTKDPDQLSPDMINTASSPRRTMTRFELVRYLDYCSEMLSISSNVAALYAQHLDEADVLSAVNSIQNLAVSLSAKIWQKIVILDTASERIGAPVENRRSGINRVGGVVPE